VPVVAPAAAPVVAPTVPVVAPRVPVVAPTVPVVAPAAAPVVAPTVPVVAPAVPVVAPSKPVALPTSAVLATAQIAVPTLVDLRLDSQPEGATVVLIDRGKSAPLGTTPLQASVDVSREYDLVFSAPDRFPRVEHVDPKSRLEVSVMLAPNPPAEPLPSPAVSRHRSKKPSSARRAR
jgi:hypothetical protein